MAYLQTQRELFKAISEFYKEETIQTRLEHANNELESIILKMLDEGADANSLLSKTSIGTNKYYKIKSRVKGIDSFEEKMIRKNLGQKLLAQCGISTIQDISEKSRELEKEIYSIDDIIGLRIVTELKSDCDSALKLLRSSRRKLERKNVVLNQSELDSQPEKMKNGLPIYKIKGVYDDKFGFELQIKSKIDEAWGDMDHSTFYKDYSFSPIKGTVQVTMNKVGELLDKIEDLLYSLRESSKEYENDLQKTATLNNLNDELSALLKTKFGYQIEINKLASALEFLREKSGAGADRLKDLNEEWLEYEVQSEKSKNYITIRNKSFELIILELTYFNWKALKADFTIKPETYEAELTIFIGLLGEHIFNQIKNKNIALASENSATDIAKRIETLSNYSPNSTLYLSVDLHELLENIDNSIDAYLTEKAEAIFDPAFTEKEKFSHLLKTLFAVKYLKENTAQIISELTEFETKDPPVLKDTIAKIVYKFFNSLELQRVNEIKKLRDGSSIQENKFFKLTEAVLNSFGNI